MATHPILVIGATGTVGGELVKQLVEAGRSVRILARNPAKAARFGRAADVVWGDLARPKTLDPAFAGVERVFILCPPVPELETLEANAFAAAKNARVGHIVNLSNFGAGSFESTIWKWHGASENRLRASGMAWTILRPTRFMSNTPYTWDSIRENGTLIEATGDSKMTLIDPRDIAAVAVRVLTSPGHEGKVYELTASEALSGAEIAQKIAAATGRPVRFVDAPPEIARASLLKSGFPELAADMVLQYFATVREGRWYLTPTAAEILGRPPRSFDQWLRDHAAAFA
ncbi:MAG: SDR family oxidoreductase [Rhodospirillales bacterium]|nr:SDR family oxidoreductase [Rhodospirillales bacterium]